MKITATNSELHRLPAAVQSLVPHITLPVDELTAAAKNLRIKIAITGAVTVAPGTANEMDLAFDFEPDPPTGK